MGSSSPCLGLDLVRPQQTTAVASSKARWLLGRTAGFGSVPRPLRWQGGALAHAPQASTNADVMLEEAPGGPS